MLAWRGRSKLREDGLPPVESRRLQAQTQIDQFMTTELKQTVQRHELTWDAMSYREMTCLTMHCNS